MGLGFNRTKFREKVRQAKDAWEQRHGRTPPDGRTSKGDDRRGTSRGDDTGMGNY